MTKTFKSNDDHIFELADELLGSALSGMSDTRADEVFQLCHICKDVDGHEDWCWVPVMKRWFDSNTVMVPPAKAKK